eukprot:ctg_341.g103
MPLFSTVYRSNERFIARSSIGRSFMASSGRCEGNERPAGKRSAAHVNVPAGGARGTGRNRKICAGRRAHDAPGDATEGERETARGNMVEATRWGREVNGIGRREAEESEGALCGDDVWNGTGESARRPADAPQRTGSGGGAASEVTPEEGEGWRGTGFTRWDAIGEAHWNSSPGCDLNDQIEQLQQARAGGTTISATTTGASACGHSQRHCLRNRRPAGAAPAATGLHARAVCAAQLLSGAIMEGATTRNPLLAGIAERPAVLVSAGGSVSAAVPAEHGASPERVVPETRARTAAPPGRRGAQPVRPRHRAEHGHRSRFGRVRGGPFCAPVRTGFGRYGTVPAAGVPLPARRRILSAIPLCAGCAPSR